MCTEVVESSRCSGHFLRQRRCLLMLGLFFMLLFRFRLLLLFGGLGRVSAGRPVLSAHGFAQIDVELVDGVLDCIVAPDEFLEVIVRQGRAALEVMHAQTENQIIIGVEQIDVLGGVRSLVLDDVPNVVLIDQPQFAFFRGLPLLFIAIAVAVAFEVVPAVAAIVALLFCLVPVVYHGHFLLFEFYRLAR